MKQVFYILFVCSSTIATAQTVTYSADVACIIYTHCTRCHNNTNSIAAIPFTNYNEAWSQRNAIKYYVANKLMPPYQPATENQTYSHEKTLTQNEIDLIVAWVNQGSKEGDTAKAPIQPVMTPLNSVIASPDISYRIPAYTVPNIVAFQYHCFVLPTTYASEKRISEIEILPTNLSAVYNAFLYSDTSTIPLTLDAADPSNGYENYARTGSSSAKLLYGWINGQPAYHTPPNMALKLDANAHLILRILFAEDAHNKIDSTQVNIKFETTTTSRTIEVATLLSHEHNLQNPPFVIEADSIKTFYVQDTIKSDISLLSVTHWAHKFCSNMSCYAITPANDTISLLEIEDHEDLWSQGVYHYYKPVRIPAGTVLIGRAEYDNTANNPNNPFSPPHTIYAGNADTSEQLLCAFSYIPYITGDESLIADSIIHQLHYLNCSPVHTVTGIEDIITENNFSIYPNPATNELNIVSKDNGKFSVSIFNSVGQKMYSTQVVSNCQLSVANYSSGLYFIQINTGKNFITQKIIKQ